MKQKKPAYMLYVDISQLYEDITTTDGVQKLYLKLRVCRGAYDHFLRWPIRESFQLKVVKSTGEAFEEYFVLDTTQGALEECNKPTTSQNDAIWSVENIEVGKIENAECIKNDTVRVQFRITS